MRGCCDKMNGATESVHLPAAPSATAFGKKGHVMARSIVRKRHSPVNRNSVATRPPIRTGDIFRGADGRSMATYVCHCGVEFITRCGDVTAGKSRSCGCGRMSVQQSRTKHPLYHTWTGIIDRCFNQQAKQWDDYGGRGISMCAEWRCSFDEFSSYITEAIGPRPSKEYTLDRIDNDKWYEPGNLRWATRLTQNRNQRRVTKNTDGIPVIALAERIGVVNPATARARVNEQGWSIERAVSSPPRFETYQPVTHVERVDNGVSRHLLLTLQCGCIVKRQWRNYRPIPSVAICHSHTGRFANASK